MRTVFGLVVAAGLMGAPVVRGGDPLPPPRSVPVVVWPAPVYTPPIYHRASAYDVWQYYAVDRQGQWRARVVSEPGERTYYLYNGQPYPWASVHPRYFTPTVQGTPYRTLMPYARD